MRIISEAGMTDGIFREALVVAAALVSTGVLYALAGISVPVALAASIAASLSMAWLIAGGE